MNYTKEIAFLAASLGWFNGIILGIYFLFFNKPRRLPNVFFGLFLLSLSFRIAKSAIWFLNPDVPFIIIQAGLAVCLFPGPLLWFFVKYNLKEGTLLRWEKGLLAGYILLFLFVLTYFYPHTRIFEWKRYLVPFVYFHWLFYALLVTVPLFPLFKKLFNPQKLLPREKWLLMVYVGNLAVVLSYILSYTSAFRIVYITGSITFTLVIYLNIFVFVLRDRARVFFQQEATPKYLKKIEGDEVNVILEKLEKAMVEGIFKKNDLRLPELADYINTSPHRLSQVLNDNLQKSFSSYINGYRIARACEMMDAGNDFKMEAVGYEVGFNSKSAFYNAFKKEKGISPHFYKTKDDK